jgi:hypothetical protein
MAWLLCNGFHRQIETFVSIWKHLEDSLLCSECDHALSPLLLYWKCCTLWGGNSGVSRRQPPPTPPIKEHASRRY